MAPFGFINCDKPIGMTSRDVVNIVSGCLPKTKERKKIKMGHAGTLDPLAEGVLVLGVGRAVRLVPYVQQQPKFYRGTFLLGQTSESGDLEGEVTLHPNFDPPSLGDLQSAAIGLTGRITQVPPAYSAIKINGRRAYDLIRSGQPVDMPSREVDVHHVRVTRYEYPEFDLDVGCGSGTYIRTLGMDLAIAAGSVSVMKHLRRYAIGVFDESDSVSIDQIRRSDPCDFLRPATDGIGSMPRMMIEDVHAGRLIHGLDLNLDAKDVAGQVVTDGEVAAIWQGELFAILHRREGQWWPRRVFPRD